MAVFQLILFPIVNYYFILFITNVSFPFSVKNMLIVVTSLSVPLAILKYFVLPFIPEVFLVKEIIVAMLTFAIAAMLLVFYKELKNSLIRVKGF